MKKSELKADVKMQRILMKNIAKELKVNVLEVEYLISEMGIASIIGNEQGLRKEMIENLDSAIEKEPHLKSIQTALNRCWLGGVERAEAGQVN